MTTMTMDRMPCSSRIWARDRPMRSFQNRVMIAIGKRVICRKEKAYSFLMLERVVFIKNEDNPSQMCGQLACLGKVSPDQQVMQRETELYRFFDQGDLLCF